MKINIIHVIGSLKSGGAENQLVTLALEQARQGDTVSIIVFEIYETKLEKICIENNINLINIKLKKKSILKGFLNLNKNLKKLNAQKSIIQSWMYTADLFVSLCFIINIFNFSQKNYKIFWNIRSTVFTGFKEFSLSRYLIACSCIPLSYFIPVKIINCAHAAKNSHMAWGYKKSKMEVIHNSFDASKFIYKPNKIKNKDFTIGFVGRNDPIKNFSEFVNLIEDITKIGISVKGVVAGREHNVSFVKSISENEDVIQRIKFIGDIENVVEMYHNLDLLVCLSFSEGFPNIIAEASLCGVDCLSYDVGDVSYIIPKGNIIYERDYSLMLIKVLKKIDDFNSSKTNRNPKMVREHIQENFNIIKIVNSYKDLYLGSEITK